MSHITCPGVGVEELPGRLWGVSSACPQLAFCSNSLKFCHCLCLSRSCPTSKSHPFHKCLFFLHSIPGQSSFPSWFYARVHKLHVALHQELLQAGLTVHLFSYLPIRFTWFAFSRAGTKQIQRKKKDHLWQPHHCGGYKNEAMKQDRQSLFTQRLQSSPLSAPQIKLY